jgi:hypothetical protein
VVIKKKMKIRVKKEIKQRTPHRPTRMHRDRKKYTRKGRQSNRRRKDLLRDWQQGMER